MSKSGTEFAALTNDDLGEPQTDMDVSFLETASDRMMAALESQEAQDAQRTMDIESALEWAPEAQLLAEVKRRAL